MQKQPNSAYCFVCGLDNTAGVKVRFYETVSGDGAAELLARFAGQPCRQGYPGRMHGGVLTRNRPMFTGSGEIYLPDGTVAMRAEGKFLQLPLIAISREDVDLPGWQLYQDEE